MKTKTVTILLSHIWGTEYHTWSIEYRGKSIAESPHDGVYLGKCAGAMVADASRTAYKLGYRSFKVKLHDSCGAI